MCKHPSNNVVEIDVSKAYTAAFCDITEIPIFNELDAFKPYGDEEILPLSLYVVKDFSHPLTTQDRSLVYGKKVDYAKLVAELYDAKVSDDPQQDIYVKKLMLTSVYLRRVLVSNR